MWFYQGPESNMATVSLIVISPDCGWKVMSRLDCEPHRENGLIVFVDCMRPVQSKWQKMDGWITQIKNK